MTPVTVEMAQSPLVSERPHEDTLTTWQARALENRFNLSDGHARDSLHPAELQAAESASGCVTKRYDLDSGQARVERSFVDTHLALAGEPACDESWSRHFVYSASTGIALAAQALSSLGHRRIAVLHPSFDNIPLLLRRNGLEPIPVDETDLFEACRRLEEPLFLTLPNNPTGFHLDETQLAEVVQQCEARAVPLVVDLTFRFLAPSPFAVYPVLAAASDPGCIAIEDTGKTWPLNDLKCSFLSVRGDDLPSAVATVVDELLLNVSPSLLELVGSVMGASLEVPVDGSPLLARRNLVERNRSALRRVVSPYSI